MDLDVVLLMGNLIAAAALAVINYNAAQRPKLKPSTHVGLLLLFFGLQFTQQFRIIRANEHNRVGHIQLIGLHPVADDQPLFADHHLAFQATYKADGPIFAAKSRHLALVLDGSPTYEQQQNAFDFLDQMRSVPIRQAGQDQPADYPWSTIAETPQTLTDVQVRSLLQGSSTLYVLGYTIWKDANGNTVRPLYTCRYLKSPLPTVLDATIKWTDCVYHLSGTD